MNIVSHRKAADAKTPSPRGANFMPEFGCFMIECLYFLVCFNRYTIVAFSQPRRIDLTADTHQTCAWWKQTCDSGWLTSCNPSILYPTPLQTRNDRAAAAQKRAPDHQHKLLPHGSCVSFFPPIFLFREHSPLSFLVIRVLAASQFLRCLRTDRFR